MAATDTTKIPGSYWPVAGLALLWQAMGVASYLGQVYGAAGMSPAQQQLVASTPAWVTGAYAIAVFAGLIGAIGLLLRKRWAKPLFIVSLIAGLLQFGWVFGVGGAIDLLGVSAVVLPIIVLVIGAGLVWFSNHADRKGWLN